MKRILSSAVLMAGLTVITLPAEAYYGYHGYHGYNGYHGYRHGYYGGSGVSISVGTGPVYYQSYPAYSAHCRWVPGHWNNGYWYPATKVCNNAGYYYREPHCAWVGGYWSHGLWYPAQRRCW